MVNTEKILDTIQRDKYGIRIRLSKYNGRKSLDIWGMYYKNGNLHHTKDKWFKLDGGDFELFMDILKSNEEEIRKFLSDA
jgi:hypothetical protein